MHLTRPLLCAVALVSTIATATANAQDKYQWVNTTLIERKMPQEQYVSIGKAHLAQCQISANREVRTTIAERIQACDSRAMPMVCASERGKAEAAGQELYRTLFTGCMAEKGWLWTKIE